MSNKTKLIIGAIGLVVILSLVVYQFQSKSNGSIKVGVILPMTGQYAMFGESLKQAIEMSRAKLDPKVATNMTIIYEDDQYDAKTAVSAYHKLKDIDGVNVVVVLGAPSIEALKPLVTKDNIVMLALGESLFHEPDTIFQLMPAGDLIFPTLGQLASKNYKNIAVVSAPSSLFTLNANLFKQGLAKETGMQDIVVATDDQIRTSVTKLLASKAEATTVMLPLDSGIKFLRELKNQKGGRSIAIICDANMQLAIGEYIKAVGEEMLNGCLSATLPNTFSSWFLADYKAKYKTEPILTADYAYDSIGMIAELVQKYPVADWSKVLAKDYHYTGASGEITFNQNGTRSGGVAVYKLQGGRFVEVK